MLKMMFSKLFRLHFIFEVTRCGFKKIIQIIISNSLFCTELIDIAIFKNFMLMKEEELQQLSIWKKRWKS